MFVSIDTQKLSYCAKHTWDKEITSAITRQRVEQPTQKYKIVQVPLLNENEYTPRTSGNCNQIWSGSLLFEHHFVCGEFSYSLLVSYQAPVRRRGVSSPASSQI